MILFNTNKLFIIQNILSIYFVIDLKIKKKSVMNQPPSSHLKYEFLFIVST